MKVAQINVNYGFGSTGVIVKDLQRLCVENGIVCEVVYAEAKEVVSAGYRMGNFFSNKLHALLSRIAGKQGYFSILSTICLIAHLKHSCPDVLHLHNLHSCYINLPILLKYAGHNNIQVVVTLHDCWFYTGGCCHYTAAGCNKWKHACGNCPKRKEFDVNALLVDGTATTLRDRYRLFGGIKNLAVVGVSNWIVKEAHKTVFKNAKCVSIHNGIDTEFFHPVDSDFRKKYGLEGKKVILAPANKWFLEVNRRTFDYFASKLTDEMRMVFIGTGCDESRLSGNMINIGYITSREEIRAIYGAADVMVNCTREESLSLLNVEVQACGTPVITYSNTGVKETVDGVCGFAIENSNENALWLKTVELLTAGKEKYREDAIAWVKREYDVHKNYLKYIELYKSITV